MNETLTFRTTNNAATHLGRKLYNSTPPAIAELVANSYDAYATEINLELKSHGKTIVVADNGVGMTVDQLVARYAQIGMPKKNIDVPEGMSRRNPMGKKGIGKLASFSLGDSYTVYTRTCADTEWISFTVEYRNMVTKFEDSQTQYEYPAQINHLETLPSHLKTFDADHGFIVEINSLRREITQTTLKHLENQLRRRFTIRSGEVAINLNGAPLEMSRDEIFYKYVESAVYIGYTDEEITEQFTDGQRISRASLSAKDKDVREIIIDLEGDGVKIWVGTIDKPARLKELELGGVVVYINGKVADEDFLKNEKSAQMGGNYIVGEVYADYLNDSDEEPITSSRQGLETGDGEVEKILKVVVSLQNQAIREWNRLREANAIRIVGGPIADDEKYQNWVNNLNSHQKKFNSSLLKSLGALGDYDDGAWLSKSERISIINGITSLVEASKAIDIDDQLQNIDLTDHKTILRLIGSFMGVVATQEKIQMAEAAAKRLQAIEQLKMIMGDQKSLEAYFQKHLSENPWLLNPYWNTTGKEINTELKEQFYGKDPERGDKGFIDILVQVNEETLPIIVELKKHTPTGYASPSNITYSNIFDQVDKYRRIIVNYEANRQRTILRRDIKAIFVAPENTSGGARTRLTHGLDEEDIASLRGDNIEVTTYEKLIENARAMYSDILQARSKVNDTVPYFAANYENEKRKS